VSLDRPLSPLELTALGIILKKAPCVAHEVVKEFHGSQTFAYRSGAGAVYPLLKRLTNAGYLACEKKRFRLTEDGIEALRNWLRPPFDDLAISTNLDLLRSRAYFLKLLTPEEARDFVDYSLIELTKLLEDCHKSVRGYQASADKFSELAMMGAVRETEARIGWLNEMRAAFDHLQRLPE